MQSSVNTRGKRATSKSSLFGLIRLIVRLTPRQISDEMSLAVAQMKQKGMSAGIAAAFVLGALVFVAAFAVALIVAAISALAALVPTWLAALIVAAVFLLIAGILALLGVARFKKVLPLVPQDALRGIRYDLGVLREGRSFDPGTLEAKKPDAEKKTADEPEAPKAPAPTYEELRGRSGDRRAHLAELRDSLGTRVDVKERIRVAKANARGRRAAADVAHNTSLADRWKPLSALAGSVAAAVVLLRRLLSR